ncbi:MAG TPA: DUF362 domain-containing protein [Victivallis vadensis]|nr:DUF362 domain-containing protein [Victivallis vadensis]
MNRRDFLKSALMFAVLSPTAGILAKASGTVTGGGENATVYFTRNISPEAVIRMYQALGLTLPGKVAVKVHSGEKGNRNFLRPEFLRPMVETVKGTVVECNTAYEGAWNSTAEHRQLIAEHGWTKYFTVDLMDAEGPDMILPISGGKILKRNYVGKNMGNYDSMLVLSHFKGHPVAGYGGALKQLSIGCASIKGKALIHSGGISGDQIECWKHMATPEVFGDAMAEAAGTIVDYFKNRIAFINMMCNLSVDCDCCAVAEEPCMKDIGILSSTDPVALDQACMDLIRRSKDPGRDHFLERVTSRKGTRVIDTAAARGVGTKRYELIQVDA